MWYSVDIAGAIFSPYGLDSPMGPVEGAPARASGAGLEPTKSNIRSSCPKSRITVVHRLSPAG